MKKREMAMCVLAGAALSVLGLMQLEGEPASVGGAEPEQREVVVASVLSTPQPLSRAADQEPVIDEVWEEPGVPKVVVDRRLAEKLGEVAISCPVGEEWADFFLPAESGQIEDGWFTHRVSALSGSHVVETTRVVEGAQVLTVEREALFVVSWEADALGDAAACTVTSPQLAVLEVSVVDEAADFTDEEALLSAYSELLAGALDEDVADAISRKKRVLETRLATFRWAAEIDAVKLELEALQHREDASDEEKQALLARQEAAVKGLTEAMMEADAAFRE